MAGPRGGGPGGRGQRPLEKPKNVGTTIRRIFSYMKEFKPMIILVVVFIIISALASVIGTSFLQRVIDDCIKPMLDGETSEGMSKLIKTLTVMGIIYVIGAASTFCYARIMLNVSTKTLYKIRVDLFTKMEALPIRFFDTHTHGEVMSRYTNDVDTLREMLSNSLASFISAAITVTGVFVMMVYYSWQLTLIVILLFFVIVKLTAFIGSRSGAYFKEQQMNVGKANGYIEEMIEGVKVVKVFCHEDKAKREFDVINDDLRKAATKANKARFSQ